MKLSYAMGIISILFAPLIGLGLALENFTYWIALDIVMLIFFPLLGIRLIQESKKTN